MKSVFLWPYYTWLKSKYLGYPAFDKFHTKVMSLLSVWQKKTKNIWVEYCTIFWAPKPVYWLEMFPGYSSDYWEKDEIRPNSWPDIPRYKFKFVSKTCMSNPVESLG